MAVVVPREGGGSRPSNGLQKAPNIPPHLPLPTMASLYCSTSANSASRFLTGHLLTASSHPLRFWTQRAADGLAYVLQASCCCCSCATKLAGGGTEHRNHSRVCWPIAVPISLPGSAWSWLHNYLRGVFTHHLVSLPLPCPFCKGGRSSTIWPRSWLGMRTFP